MTVSSMVDREPRPGAGRGARSAKGCGPAVMIKKENREYLAKALDESRRSEKEIIHADAQEDDELDEKIIERSSNRSLKRQIQLADPWPWGSAKVRYSGWNPLRKTAAFSESSQACSAAVRFRKRWPEYFIKKTAHVRLAESSLASRGAHDGQSAGVGPASDGPWAHPKECPDFRGGEQSLAFHVVTTFSDN